jgi:low temperature requirement A protein (LtrA)
VIPRGRSARHPRPRGEGVEQPITTVELFFDLVYVFAITQLSHMILGDLTVAGVGRQAPAAVDPGRRPRPLRPGGGYWLPRRGQAVTTDYDIVGLALVLGGPAL